MIGGARFPVVLDKLIKSKLNLRHNFDCKTVTVGNNQDTLLSVFVKMRMPIDANDCIEWFILSVVTSIVYHSYVPSSIVRIIAPLAQYPPNIQHLPKCYHNHSTNL